MTGKKRRGLHKRMNKSEQMLRIVDTHALPGVALSEFKLRLSGVLLTLIPNIASDDRFVDAHRTHEKSSSPDPSTIPIHSQRDGNALRDFMRLGFESATMECFRKFSELH